MNLLDITKDGFLLQIVLDVNLYFEVNCLADLPKLYITGTA